MKKMNVGFMFTMTFLLASCGASWVKLDNSTADSSIIKEAKAKCQVEEKIYTLSYQEIATKAAIQSVSDQAAKESIEEGYKMKEQKVYEEIDACMAVEGLKQKN